MSYRIGALYHGIMSISVDMGKLGRYSIYQDAIHNRRAKCSQAPNAYVVHVEKPTAE